MTKCKCKRKTKYDIVDTINQSKNGAKVIKHVFRDGGTYIDCSCACFGSGFRAHSNMSCPNIPKKVNNEKKV